MSSFSLEHATFKGKLPDEDSYIYIFDRVLIHPPHGTCWASKQQVLSVGQWHNANPEDSRKVSAKDELSKLVFSFVPVDAEHDID